MSINQDVPLYQGIIDPFRFVIVARPHQSRSEEERASQPLQANGNPAASIFGRLYWSL